MMIDREDLDEALRVIESRYPDAAWSLSRLTGQHVYWTDQKGCAVQLHYKNECTFEVRKTFTAAVTIACDRLERRINGEKGA